MTWQEICGNGARIDMIVITTQVRLNVIPPAPVQANGEFCAAVRGAPTMRIACAVPIATTTVQLPHTPITDFVVPSSFPSPLPLCVFAFMLLLFVSEAGSAACGADREIFSDSWLTQIVHVLNFRKDVGLHSLLP